ncbi:oligosaccharide repeat unit polymerase [Chryseobacterium carnipullorum]|uniref:O-antigen polymerase n=1 Tax=Chryseobacterium carnipullorum TaxID=1124835 RepID=UPI000917003B|nr:O-antigen polymerase [Chryseobacterium carnipullorum]SHM64062.1 oligosaccharide repeat unit polymerase [Chryseobacterium carnipullorum]
MSLFIGFMLLLLSFIGYIYDKKILNPLFIMPFIWGIILLLFNIVPHNIYQLQSQFLLSLILWILSFMSVAFFTLSFKINTQTSIFNPKIFTIYYYLVIICAPIAIFLIVREALKVGPELFFLKLRLMNTGIDEDSTFSLGPLAYVYNLANIVCLLFTFYFDKISKKRYYIVLAIAIFLSLITLARTSIVMLLIEIIVILYFKGKLNKKAIVKFGTTIVVFLGIVTFFRSLAPWEKSVPFLETFSTYLFAGMSAFDTINHQYELQTGNYTFRFFYAVANALGSSYEVKQNILPYVYVPIPTNVYTILYPFYKDFGYLGVFTFGSIYGFIFGILYKFANSKNELAIILFAIVFPCLALQFMGENIFLNLSTYLQYLIILLIPYYLKRI